MKNSDFTVHAKRQKLVMEELLRISPFSSTNARVFCLAIKLFV